MRLVDSHCHLDCLDLEKYGGKVEGALTAAREQGVVHMLCVCIDLEHFPNVLAVADQHEDVTASVGLHPNEQVEHEPTIDQLIQLAEHPKVVAIGETGLDYYRSEGEAALTTQHKRFCVHIAAAKALKKPLIVHSRQAREDTIRLLRTEGAAEAGGVLHCFTENWEMAKQALDLGFYISFSGIVTFKNATEIQEVVKKMPLDRILIETDAPYLAPTPYRGKPNEPAYVRYVAEQVAALKGLSVEAVAEQTTRNFVDLFALDFGHSPSL